jgi:hypothetical protein
MLKKVSTRRLLVLSVAAALMPPGVVYANTLTACGMTLRDVLDLRNLPVFLHEFLPAGPPLSLVLLLGLLAQAFSAAIGGIVLRLLLKIRENVQASPRACVKITWFANVIAILAGGVPVLIWIFLRGQQPANPLLITPIIVATSLVCYAQVFKRMICDAHNKPVSNGERVQHS